MRESSFIADVNLSLRTESTKHRIKDIWIRHSSMMHVISEVAFVVTAYFAYAIGRGLVYDNQMLPAFDNAWEIISLERITGIFSEVRVQDWLLDNSPTSVRFFNWFYVLGYWPVVLLIAIFLYLRNRQAYYKYRTVALITFGITLIIYELYPLAPPRMLSTLGFVDTILRFGPEEYHAASDALLYNPYAAMPSLHFGMTFVVSMYFLRSRGEVICKLFVLGYLGLMLASIVVTGNHYIVDAVGSVCVVGAAFIIYNLSVSLLCKLKKNSSTTLLDRRNPTRGKATDSLREWLATHYPKLRL